ncbi:hydrogenase nickel incorporation protein HypB [Thauera chlorobenzoica]|uniref:Hydrogenase maturation factor HypB n=1 Tax=Thauera chlorobenzoica TaxID=96773 RepID=A0A1H5SW16_9RHOO|nr:hydrogenase nickel incorporation protein HypB [Thauera chlorobenzoica]APR04050.1 [NiFe] hydrogenase nickel incorporation-associated protein HypB [Thauera chlorobenzoica]SEF54783.1 Hydrogenase nickel incorporation protein HypB [Thauera chlorobenzoica]
MCTTCGCGGGEARIGAVFGGRKEARAAHQRAPAERPHRWRALSADPPAPGNARPLPTADTYGHPPAHRPPAADPAHVAAPTPTRMLEIERDLLARNDALAAANRAAFAARGIFALNLVSSPGSGKTSLLVRMLQALAGRIPAAVIEGDQQTEFDAERIRATGVPALQINTGKGCHLDAGMIARALARMDLAAGSLLLIENVGNLVCPAAFDLGEAHKVAILSVTEGEDKPLKYPDMFAAADLLLLNKVDLLPYLVFDARRAIDYALRVNPRLRVIQTSATTGAGVGEWIDWIEAGLAAARAGRGASA